MVELSIHAPRQVRDSLELQYAATMERSLLDDVKILTSELVTNAVKHSGCPTGDPLTLQTSVLDDVLRVEIIDRGNDMSELAPRTISPPSGLGLVQLLSDRWSSHRTDAFHVWFEIDLGSDAMLCRRPAG
jgi:anti-sigma regulatory factor (Ser/Thr protein kinase)